VSGTDAFGNDVSAVGTLRRIAIAQAQFQSDARLDLDGDGIGEYGTLAEVSGAAGLRLDPAATRRGAALDPPLLPPWTKAAVGAGGIMSKAGYQFRVHLPGPDGVHEGPLATLIAALVDTDAAEVRWWAYAWPEAWGVTGECAAYVDSTGTVLICDNETARWSGTGRAPPAEPVPAPGATHGGETWREWE